MIPKWTILERAWCLMASKDKAAASAKVAPPTRGAAVRPHHDERVATSLSRDAHRRESFEFQLRVTFGLLVVLAISVCFNILLSLRQPEVRYFATDPNGKVTELVALERPIQGTTEVINWAQIAVVRAFTLSFGSYQQQLEDSRNLFTESGWAGFREALQRNGVLDTLISQQMVTSVVPSGAPVILDQGVVDNGRYAWRLQMPLLISYESASRVSPQTMTVEALIVRRPETENPQGLGIGQIIAR